MSALVQIISIRRKRLLKKVREEGSSGFGLTEENTFQLARVSPGGNADSTRGNRLDGHDGNWAQFMLRVATALTC